jgi:hypothetical protein
MPLVSPGRRARAAMPESEDLPEASVRNRHEKERPYTPAAAGTAFVAHSLPEIPDLEGIFHVRN